MEPAGARVGHAFGARRQRAPFPVGGPRPVEALEVERQIADLRPDGIDVSTRQPIVQPPRQEQNLSRPGNEVRLMFGEPVEFGLALEIFDDRCQPSRLEREAPPQRQARRARCAPLIEPDDEWAQRPAIRVERHERPALRCHDQALRPRIQIAVRAPKIAAHGGGRLPERLGVVLQPVVLQRRIVVERVLSLGDDGAVEVNQQRAHALRAAIDCQQQFVRSATDDASCGTE